MAYSTSSQKPRTFIGKMIRKYEERVATEQFYPTFPLGWIVNPFYISRRSLYLYIKKLAPMCNGVFLDFGCGIMPYRRLFSYERYIGIEYGDPSLSTDEIIYVQDSSVPFPDDYFDTIICTQVLEHVPHPEAILAEFYRVLKTRGKLLLSVPMTWAEHAHPHDFRRFTPEGLNQLLYRYGFNVKFLIRTTGTVLTIAQLIMDFIRQKLYGKGYNLWILSWRLMIGLTLYTPLLTMAYFLSAIIRDQEKLLPLDIIVLAEK